MLPEKPAGLQARIAELEAENTELRRRLADPAQDSAAHVEATLRESEANWRLLVESIPEFLMLLDPDGVIRWINYPAPTFRREELIGVNVLDFATPETRPVVEQAFRTAQDTGQTVDYVCAADVKGQRIRYHGRTKVLTEARTPGQMLTIARDITEQWRTEERLRMLEVAVVHAPDAILLTEAAPLDEPGPRILYVNPAFTAMTGYSAEEVLGRSPRFLQGRETAPAAQAAVRTALKSRQPVSVEIVNYRKTGEPFWVELSITPIVNAAGECTHFVSVQRELTERKRAEEESRRIQCKMQEAQKLESLGVLAGGVAHDFNNLLTVILGNTSLARLHTPEQPSLQACFEQIDQAAMRAADLCRQMLAYSGRGRFVVVPLDLSALVRESSPLLRSAVSKKTTLRLNLVENLPAVVADAVQLRQIMMNLVLNASEALDQQPGTVVVETGLMHADTDYLAATRSFTDLSEGKYVFLEVRDSGCGMTPEVQERIFDPFYTTKFTGRGLGLAAVLGIVRGHGGALRVKSEAGVGTSFRLLLPPSDTLAANRGVEAPKPQWHGEGVVLIVDDEDAVRTLAARMLNSTGFEILEAADGQTAVEVYAREAARIRLVLLDLMMPRLDGAQALQEMRRVRPDVRAVVMSGYTVHEMSQRFGDAPPAGFLQKPFVREQLFSLVARVLEV
jgi:PAS domain S-box-containing protein